MKSEPVVEKLEIRRAHNGWIIKQVGWVHRDVPGMVDDVEAFLEERTLVAEDVDGMMKILTEMLWPVATRDK